MAQKDGEEFEKRVVSHMDALQGLSRGELHALQSSFEGDDDEYQPEYRTALARSINNLTFDTLCE